MSADETAPKPRCPWCGQEFSSWSTVEIRRHVKNCKHSPRPRWRRNAAPAPRTVVEILLEAGHESVVDVQNDRSA